MRIGVAWAVVLVVTCMASMRDARADEPYPVKRLTDDPAQDGFPSWSPDGRSIVFSRYGGEDAPEKTGLWLISPEGGEPRRLTSVIGEHPDWSPDGRFIAFDGDSGHCIQVVSASGGTPIRVDPESIAVANGGQPKWSPEGARLAFKAGSALWVLDVATGQAEKIFSDPGKRPLPACWSHDGEEIYLYLRDAKGPGASIALVSVKGRSLRELAREEGAVCRYADLSPDGSLLVVVWCEGRICNLWVMPSAGGPRARITSNPGYDDGPSWSPDGRSIAFVSTRSGNFDIWIVKPDLDRVRKELAATSK